MNMKTFTSSQSLTVLMFLVAACGGTSSLGGGDDAGGAAGSGGSCVSCGSGGSDQGTGGTATGGTDGKGTGGTATGGSGGKGTGGTATGGSGGSGTGGTATGGSGGSVGNECIGNIEFANPEIEKIAAMAVGKQPPLRGADVAAITELTYEWNERAPITSLRGLQCFVSLRSFIARGPDLRSVGLVDLTALSGLPALSWVTLSADRSTDFGEPFADLNIAPLSRVSTLTNLSVTSKALADISSVALLQNLEYLSINSNRVSDLSALAQLPKLVRANVFGRGITDIAPLAAALRANQGVHLTAARVSVSDWSPVAAITSLKSLSVGSNAGIDLSQFTSLPALLGFNVQDSELTQIAVSPSVTTLDLSWNPNIANYATLASSNVRNLVVSSNNITDLTPFLAITSLDGGGSLDLMANPIDCATQTPHIQALRSRGVKVYQECLP